MIGHSVVQQVGDRGHGCGEGEAREKTETILRIEDVTALNNSKIPSLSGLSLELRKGEIVGITGVDGNSQQDCGSYIRSKEGRKRTYNYGWALTRKSIS